MTLPRLMHGYMDRGHDHGTHAICTEDGKPLEMTAENVEEIVNRSNSRYLAEPGITHWEECWRDHYICAMRRIAELTERNQMLTHIALSAVALKLNLEHGFTPSLHALNRDLSLFAVRFGHIMVDGLKERKVENAGRDQPS